MKTIKVNLDSNGNAHINLYGEHITLSRDEFDESGKAKFTKFGEEYLAEINRSIRKSNSSPTKVKTVLEKEQNKK